MIAAIPLRKHLYACSAKLPFVRQKTSAAIRVLLVEAGRFDESELTQSVRHPRQEFAKVSEERFGESLGFHSKQMVATPVAAYNSAPQR